MCFIWYNSIRMLSFNFLSERKKEMKKFISILLALVLIFTMATVFTACKKGGEEEPEEPETTTAAEVEEEEEDTTEDANVPKAGDTVALGSASVVIPAGWTVGDYREGEEIEIMPEGAFMESVTLTRSSVYGDEHAKEWANNINENYGGDKEIDTVTIAGRDFYRVKADSEQNICFTDLDDSSYLKVSVMFMPWEDGQPVLDAITIK